MLRLAEAMPPGTARAPSRRPATDLPPRAQATHPTPSAPVQGAMGLRESGCCFSVCLSLCVMNLHHLQKKV